jgi:hypothetical protein
MSRQLVYHVTPVGLYDTHCPHRNQEWCCNCKQVSVHLGSPGFTGRGNLFDGNGVLIGHVCSTCRATERHAATKVGVLKSERAMCAVPVSLYISSITLQLICVHTFRLICLFCERSKCARMNCTRVKEKHRGIPKYVCHLSVLSIVSLPPHIHPHTTPCFVLPESLTVTF